MIVIKKIDQKLKCLNQIKLFCDFWISRISIIYSWEYFWFLSLLVRNARNLKITL